MTQVDIKKRTAKVIAPKTTYVEGRHWVYAHEEYAIENGTPEVYGVKLQRIAKIISINKNFHRKDDHCLVTFDSGDTAVMVDYPRTYQYGDYLMTVPNGSDLTNTLPAVRTQIFQANIKFKGRHTGPVKILNKRANVLAFNPRLNPSLFNSNSLPLRFQEFSLYLKIQLPSREVAKRHALVLDKFTVGSTGVTSAIAASTVVSTGVSLSSVSSAIFAVGVVFASGFIAQLNRNKNVVKGEVVSTKKTSWADAAIESTFAKEVNAPTPQKPPRTLHEELTDLAFRLDKRTMVSIALNNSSLDSSGFSLLSKIDFLDKLSGENKLDAGNKINFDLALSSGLIPTLNNYLSSLDNMMTKEEKKRIALESVKQIRTVALLIEDVRKAHAKSHLDVVSIQSHYLHSIRPTSALNLEKEK